MVIYGLWVIPCIAQWLAYCLTCFKWVMHCLGLVLAVLGDVNATGLSCVSCVSAISQ